MSVRLSMIVVLCAVTGMPAISGQSYGEEKEKLTAEERIEKTLEQKTSFEFDETSLQDVADFLAETHDIPIKLDGKALSDEGLDPESPITYSLKQVKLRSALNLMLRDLDLSYVVDNEVLEITTTAASKERLETKVYAVSELVGNCGDKLESLIDIITACIAAESWTEAGGEGSIRPLVLNDQSVLVISQTYMVHRELDALLDKLQAIANR